MSKLENLEEELYGKEPDEDIQKRMRKRITFLGTLKKLPTSWLGRGQERSPEEKTVTVDRRALKYFFAGLAVFFIIGASVFLFFYLGTRGQEVEITIHGRDSIESGEIVTVPITIRNVSNTVLREAEAIIVLPRGSVFREEGVERPAPPRITKQVNDLAPGGEVTIEVAVRPFGHEGEEKEFEVRFLYRPENLQARFATKALKVFKVNRVPLALFWKTPETLSHGQDMEIEVRYTSTAHAPFDDLAFRIEYPPGFTFNSADPEPTIGDTIWEIGRLEPGEEGLITLNGSIVGEEGEIKAFRGGLGVFNKLTKEWNQYSESSHVVKIAVTPLSVQGFWGEVRERVVVPGEQPSFNIRYRNNTSSILKNIKIQVFLEGDILLFSRLSIDNGGVFDATRGGIVWGPGGTPALREVAPGEEGELAFRLETREQPLVRDGGDKNLTIKLRSTIEAGSVPQELTGTDLTSEDVIEFKVATRINFSGRVAHRISPIPNSGSLPPRVGQETTYAMVWEIRNFTNDIRDAKVRLSLPPNVRWKDVTFPSDQNIQFNAVTGEVRWNIGTLQAGVGVLSPALVGSFQVGIVPAEADVGHAPTLVGRSVFSGTDAFTGEQLEITLESFTTDIIEDIESGVNFGRVVR